MYVLIIIALYFVHSEISVIYEKICYQKSGNVIEIKFLYSFILKNKNYVYYIFTHTYIHIY